MLVRKNSLEEGGGTEQEAAWETLERRGEKRGVKRWGEEINLTYLLRGVKAVQRSWHPHAERFVKAMKKGLICFAVKEVI